MVLSRCTRFDREREVGDIKTALNIIRPALNDDISRMESRNGIKAGIVLERRGELAIIVAEIGRKEKVDPLER